MRDHDLDDWEDETTELDIFPAGELIRLPLGVAQELDALVDDREAAR
jgi:hypothetical protein